tara:strand:+ start:2831 stop:3028 length:198 start_codon:yes stop_codon:yes gene_type:complete
MCEEPDVDNWDEYAMSGIEDPAMEEVAQKYEDIERPKTTHVRCCGEMWDLEHVKICLKCNTKLRD